MSRKKKKIPKAKRVIKALNDEQFAAFKKIWTAKGGRASVQSRFAGKTNEEIGNLMSKVGKASVRSRFRYKTPEQISAIMSKVRGTRTITTAKLAIRGIKRTA